MADTTHSVSGTFTLALKDISGAQDSSKYAPQISVSDGSNSGDGASWKIDSHGSGVATLVNSSGSALDTNTGAAGATTLRVVMATSAHASTNVDQVNGTTVDTNSGNKSAGTMRVVLATDQPALTNAQPTTQNAQTPLSTTLCSAFTSTGAQAGVSFSGYNGAIYLEVVAVSSAGSQSVSLEIEGSDDNFAGTNDAHAVGWQQISSNLGSGPVAVSSPTRVGGYLTYSPSGATTIRYRYQVLDAYKWYRVNVSANTLGTGVTINALAYPV